MTEPDLVTVGRIGPVHGVRGEVFVEPWTDQPEVRFAPGAVLRTKPAEAGPLTVDQARNQGSRFVVHFVGLDGREAAAALRGVELFVSTDERNPLEDPDEFYDSDLIGLRARVDGADIGSVADVVHIAGADYLALDIDGRQHLVPFIAAFVPQVDIAGGSVEIAPPPGLFEL